MVPFDVLLEHGLLSYSSAQDHLELLCIPLEEEGAIVWDPILNRYLHATGKRPDPVLHLLSRIPVQWYDDTIFPDKGPTFLKEVFDQVEKVEQMDDATAQGFAEGLLYTAVSSYLASLEVSVGVDEEAA